MCSGRAIIKVVTESEPSESRVASLRGTVDPAWSFSESIHTRSKVESFDASEEVILIEISLIVTGLNGFEFKTDSDVKSVAAAEVAAESPVNKFRRVTSGTPERVTLLSISNVPAPTCRVQEKKVFKTPV